MNYSKRIAENLNLLDRLASRRFSNQTLAEEACVYTLEKMEEEQGRRLAGYDGRARFSSYFAAVALRLFEDFSRTKFGRRRPPAWLQKLGGVWLQIYTLLCLERHEMMAAVEIMISRHRLSRATSEHMGHTIKSNVTNCGSHQGQEVHMDEEEQTDQDCDPVAEHLDQQQKKLFFQALFQIVTSESPATNHATFPSLQNLAMNLSGQEKILLKLCYQDGLPISEAGRMVGLSSNQIHGKMRRLFSRLRNEFTKAGLSEEIAAFF